MAFDPNESLNKKDSILNRDWIFFKIKMLEEQQENAFNLLADCLTSVNFEDTKRLQDLITEFKNDLFSSIVPMGNEYVSARTSFSFSKSKTVDEIWNGLTQVFFIKDLVSSDVNIISKKLQDIYQQILKLGAVIHIIADNQCCKNVIPYIETFIENCSLHKVKEFNFDRETKFNELRKIAEKNFSNNQQNLEILLTSTQVGFASVSCKSSDYNTKEFIAEKLLCHYLTNTFLWEKIRTEGGAYGAFMWTDALEKNLSFSTYRDPKPFNSLSIFRQAFEDFLNNELEQQELEKIITGCYSKEVQPKTPSARGSIGFLRYLYDFSDEWLEQKIKILLAAKKEDLYEAAKRLLEFYDAENRQAVLCGKNMNKSKKNTGKIINLPI